MKDYLGWGAKQYSTLFLFFGLSLALTNRFLTPTISAISEYKQELRLQVNAEFPDKYHGANVKVVFTVPKSSSGCSVELAPGAKGQSWEFDDASKTVRRTDESSPRRRRIDTARASTPARAYVPRAAGYMAHAQVCGRNDAAALLQIRHRDWRQCAQGDGADLAVV